MKPDLQFLTVLDFHTLGLIAEMRHDDCTRVGIQLQRKVAVFIGHHRHAACGNAHLPQGIACLVIYHMTSYHYLLSKHCKWYQR